MPIPAAIGAIGSVLGQGANFMSSAIAARQQNKQREKEYQQRKTDNIEFWRMQNAYNDPSAQRKRLQEANLNPALMYGGKGASAAGNSQSGISSVDMQPTPYREPFPNTVTGGNIDKYFDYQIKQAQADNTNVIARSNQLGNIFASRSMESRVDSELYKSNILNMKRHKADQFYLASMRRKTGTELGEIQFQMQEEALRKMQIDNKITNTLKYQELQERINILKKQNRFYEAQMLIGAAKGLIKPLNLQK